MAMSKLDRMHAIIAVFDDFDPDEAIEAVSALMEALQEVHDAREEALQAAAEALDYHEGREWDARNDSITNAINANETMLSNLEHLGDLLNMATDHVEGFLTSADGKGEAIRDHLDHLDVG
jgi:flagellar biosynthesis/type III secretory pathway chaperone